MRLSYLLSMECSERCAKFWLQVVAEPRSCGVLGVWPEGFPLGYRGDTPACLRAVVRHAYG